MRKSIVNGFEDPNFIMRPNIGIILEKVGSRYFMPLYWHHTIAVPIVATNRLLKPRNICNPFSAVGQHENCMVFPLQWKNIIWESQKLLNHLRTDIEDNEQIIKDVIALEIGRHKRGWVNFLGSIAKKVMGVATEDDIKTLAKHVQQLGQMVHAREHDRKTILENMHSYEGATNNRLDIMPQTILDIETMSTGLLNVSNNIMTFFAGNHSLPIQLQQVREHTAANEQLAKVLHFFNLHFETLQAIKASTSTLISDLNLLVEGKLSPSLVKPALLKSIIKSVRDSVSKISPKFSIASSIKDYYSKKNWITTTADNTHLFIKLKIRISSPDIKFTMFKINSYPMPLGDIKSKVYTRFSGFKKFFGISQDEKRYVEIDDIGDNDIQIMPKHVTNASCVYNLYKGHDQKILSNCKKVIEKHNNTIYPEIIHRIANNKFIILSNDNWKIVCNDSVLWDNINHRSMFQVRLKCECQLTNQKITLFPDLSSCISLENSVAYSSNMFAYFGFYNRLVDINLTVSNFHEEPYRFEIPDFKSIVQDLTKLDTLDQSEAYEVGNLEYVLNRSLTQQSDSFDNEFFDWWFDYSTVITPSSLSIGFVIDIWEVLLIGYLFFQVRTLEHRIALSFSMLPMTEAVQFTLPVSTTASPVHDLDQANDLWKSVLLVMSLVLASYSIIQQWVDRCSNAESCCQSPVVLEKLQCDVYVCLYGDNEFAHIKVKTIPCRLEDVVIHKAEGLNKIELRYKLRGPSIAVDWSLIKLGILDAGRIHLPRYTLIPLIYFCKLRRLVRNYHTVSVVGISGDDHRIISTTEVTPVKPFWRFPMPKSRTSNRSSNSSPNDSNTEVKLVVTGPSRQQDIQDDDESDVV